MVGAHPRGTSGILHHPRSEGELVELVKRAHREGRQLRVRGAAHSPAHAIYTDPPAGVPNQVDEQQPPAGNGINVMLDRYRGWRVTDRANKLVEVDAGIHLGIDPSDPTHTSTVANSLLHILSEMGWMLSETGGISHQTVSGFLGTGSAGGSFTHSFAENVWSFRIIDGTGVVHDVSRADPEFYAHAPHLGLLGVVSKITFQCVDDFNIEGDEAITTPDHCAVDVFGPGDATRKSLADFLIGTEFARVEWWPQQGCERMLVWQAKRVPPKLGFVPKPYQEFTSNPELAEFGISVVYAIVSNLSDLGHARDVLKPSYRQLSESLAKLARNKGLGPLGGLGARAGAALAGSAIDLATFAIAPFSGVVESALPQMFPRLLSAFVPLDTTDSQHFQDRGWHGLPMDDQANDVLLPLAFTEAWFPIGRAEEVLTAVRAHFDGAPDPQSALRRTGINAWELYGARASEFWLSPSYTSGADEWSEGAFRIDTYYYQSSADDPTRTFFPQFWDLFKGLGIPFRLHWGKHQPPVAARDRTWVDVFSAQYPKWDDFLALRRRRDPNNIFLTDYWRDRLGLWSAPSPVPHPSPTPAP
jgi:D-arabinono-1,4-lactone oxidase